MFSTQQAPQIALHQNVNIKPRCQGHGGQEVGFLISYSNNPSSNPAEKNKCKQKEDRVKIRNMKRFTFIYWFLQYTCITESFLKHTNHKNIFKRREHSICFENIFILFKRRIQQSYFLRKINFSIRSGMRTKPKPSPSRRRRARFIRRRKRCCFVCVSCRSQKSSLGTS